MTVEEIGSTIHKERIRKGLSCRELAELSNTSAATVCRLETGKRKGSTKAALKILKALGIELEITGEKTVESIVDPNSLYSRIEFAIKASTGTDAYMVGFRNGLRYALYLLDGKAPQYEFITMAETQKTEEQVEPTAISRQKKPKDDDISTYQEYSYMRHPDRVEMGTY
ncbi:MAG: helix-turn-helix transcriptional regulator [Blautia sp.]|nr:helix-turn-helix transcriptional regulator [Blautia sp.]